MHTALVTGANRNLGLWTVRALLLAGLRVVLTSRDPEKGRAAAATLRDSDRLLVEQLDVTSEASVDGCRDRLAEQGVDVDVLINNAAAPRWPHDFLETDTSMFEEYLATNLAGPYRLTRAFLPGMIERGYGRIVNVSSGRGSFHRGLPGPNAAYSVTKAGLNALTVRIAQVIEEGVDVKVNAVHPGPVRQRIADGASEDDIVDSIVWLATLPGDGPHGSFIENREIVEW